MKVKEARVVHAIVWLIIFVGKRKQGAKTQKINRGRNRKKEFTVLNKKRKTFTMSLSPIISEVFLLAHRLLNIPQRRQKTSTRDSSTAASIYWSTVALLGALL